MSNIGKLIFGYCNGFFGYDYVTKIIIFETDTAIVCRYLDEDDNHITVANFDNAEEKEKFIKLWSQKDYDY